MISKSLVVTGASQDVTVITPEIDDHWKMFGKEPWDIGHNLYVYCDIRNPGLRNLVIVHMVIQRISQKYLWLHSFSIYLHTPFSWTLPFCVFARNSNNGYKYHHGISFRVWLFHRTDMHIECIGASVPLVINASAPRMLYDFWRILINSLVKI